MSGRVIAVFLVLAALVAGGVMYWLQVHAYYERLAPDDVTLTISENGAPRPISVSGLRAIDAESSPIRFRACFELDGGVDGDPHPDPVPLNAPGWFDCFDAGRIGADLAAGTARAFMGQENVRYGIDRVIVVYGDGRGYAWHQINRCGEEVFDGRPPPSGCPPPPG